MDLKQASSIEENRETASENFIVVNIGYYAKFIGVPQRWIGEMSNEKEPLRPAKLSGLNGFLALTTRVQFGRGKVK